MLSIEVIEAATRLSSSLLDCSGHASVLQKELDRYTPGCWNGACVLLSIGQLDRVLEMHEADE